MTLFAEVRHTASAKAPLVLLHGFGGIGALWAPVIRRLDPDIPLIVYDLPGHGRSLDADGVGHAGVMANAILRDLDQRGIPNLHLCGHSMGGAVAALIALKASDRVRSLTLLAPGGFRPEINHVALRRYGSATGADALATALTAMMGQGSVPDPLGVDRLTKARLLPAATERLMTILQSFLVDAEGRTGQGTLPLSAFEALNLPTRLLWGTADPILPVSQATRVWPDAEVILVEGAGHMLIEEAPDQVRKAIAAALAIA
jgi:pyruvate dehydrogenase E2 component (dihydrolipoamide acetyltransferase)